MYLKDCIVMITKCQKNMDYSIKAKAVYGDKVIVENYRTANFNKEVATVESVEAKLGRDGTFTLLYRVKLVRETKPTLYRPWGRPIRLTVIDDQILHNITIETQ